MFPTGHALPCNTYQVHPDVGKPRLLQAQVFVHDWKIPCTLALAKTKGNNISLPRLTPYLLVIEHLRIPNLFFFFSSSPSLSLLSVVHSLVLATLPVSSFFSRVVVLFGLRVRSLILLSRRILSLIFIHIYFDNKPGLDRSSSLLTFQRQLVFRKTNYFLIVINSVFSCTSLVSSFQSLFYFGAVLRFAFLHRIEYPASASASAPALQLYVLY